MSREVPGSPSLLCPQHMRRTRVMAGVVESLPFPVGKIAAIDLEIADGPLADNLYSISLTYDAPATTILASCIVQGESVEIGFQVSDCGCIVPLGVWEELLNSHTKFRWRISNIGHFG